MPEAARVPIAVDRSSIALYRRATVAALVAVPLLFLADNVVHPKEYASGHEAEQLRTIADHYTRWQLAHVLGLGAILLDAVVILGLAFLVRRREPRLGLWGGALGLLGVLGFASAITLDGFSWAIVGEVAGRGGDPTTTQTVLHDLQHSQWGIAYYLPGSGLLVGTLVLALGLVRGRSVPTWTAALLAVSGVLVVLEPLIHDNAFFILGAVVTLVADLALATAIGGMTDEEFAAGGPSIAQAGIGSSASAP